ncbi:MAG TPA: DUF262 domain-containing protein [Leptolyngbyaceae cyanobacterium]
MSISHINEEVIFLEEDDDTKTNLEFRSDQKSELEKIQKVIVTNTDWSVSTILDQIIRENIYFDFRIQRRDEWDITKKSRFIESLLLGFPIPQIVLATRKNDKEFLVIDGKQRLLTILQFYGRSQSHNNGFALNNLEFRTDINGKNYEQLKNDIFKQKELDELDIQTIRTILVRNVDSVNLLYNIFLRLNVKTTGSSTQELRQVLYPGAFNEFLDNRSIKSQALKKIFKSSKPDARMRDNELLLRYIGFHFFISEYRGNLRNFLDMTCQKLNQSWNEKNYRVQTIVDKFEEAVQAIINIFGERNFSRMWLNNENTYQASFNKAILDVMLFYFTDEIIRQAAEAHQEEVVNAFKKLCSSNRDFQEGVEGNTHSVRKTYNRLRVWGEALLEVLDIEFNLPEFMENHIIFNGLR